MAKDKTDTLTTRQKLEASSGDGAETSIRTLQYLDNSAKYIPTDSLIYDIFLGGGFSPGLSRFVGEPEHGKTLQALTWGKNWLKAYGDKGRVIYFDCEGRMTAKKVVLSKINQVEMVEDKLFFIRKNVFDDIAKTIRDLINDNEEGLHYFFVFDCLDMLITKANLEKGFGDAEKVGAAQVMATLLMKHVGPYLADRGHHLMILSQIRANINIQNPNSPKTKMSGANALRHAADIIGEIIKNYTDMYIFANPKGKTLKEKGAIVGHYFTVKFTKTMNEKSGQTIRIPIKRGAGIWREREIVDLAISFGLVNVKGAWHEIVNADLIERINKDVTVAARELFIDASLKSAAADAELAGKALTKAALKDATAKATEEADKLPAFNVETKWNGYEAFFSYIENTPLLVDWFDKEFRATLLSDSVVADVSHGDIDLG